MWNSEQQVHRQKQQIDARAFDNAIGLCRDQKRHHVVTCHDKERHDRGRGQDGGDQVAFWIRRDASQRNRSVLSRQTDHRERCQRRRPHLYRREFASTLRTEPARGDDARRNPKRAQNHVGEGGLGDAPGNGRTYGDHRIDTICCRHSHCYGRAVIDPAEMADGVPGMGRTGGSAVTRSRTNAKPPRDCVEEGGSDKGSEDRMM